ncbi:MAG: MEDS domain-containing protein [Nitrospira sp.]
MPASGIRGTHEIPLGSHLCLFYRRPDEFLQVTASFLKAGLTENEFCIWVLPPPLTIPLALDELRHHGLNGRVLQAAAQLQILSAKDCWFSHGAFDVADSLWRLIALSPMARKLGFSSVRAVGGPGPFLTEASRRTFMVYEHQATDLIAEYPFIALCCYDSTACLQTDMFDVMNAHPNALLRTYSGWFNI